MAPDELNQIFEVLFRNGRCKIFRKDLAIVKQYIKGELGFCPTVIIYDGEYVEIKL